MTYPTLAEVEAADQHQLCAWYRFLPSPGTSALDQPAEFARVLSAEAVIMDRIVDRWRAGGGFTPAISKALNVKPIGKLYRVTRRTRTHVWVIWDAYGRNYPRGCSHRKTVEEFQQHYQLATDRPFNSYPLYRRVPLS